MAPPYRDSFPSSDHDDLPRYSPSVVADDHLFFPTTPQASSSSSSSLISFPTLDHSNNSDDPRPLPLNREGCNNNDQTIGNNEEMETGLSFAIWKQIDNSNNNTPNDLVKWSSSSSKIRLVINSNQIETATHTIDRGRSFQDLNQTSSSPSDQINKRSTLSDGSGAIVRTCSDCNTTKTPLWRSGPRGPKSLCNACGIRQRKARRAMAEAAAANGGGGKPTTTDVVSKTNNKKIMKPAAARIMKRKCKDVAAAAAVVAGGDGGRWSEISSSYQRVFPQDEREAAILLMTLSYGLLHG